MYASVEMPKAFSVRDDREMQLVQDLMTRLNPDLLVIQVATGVHVDGGSTVNWGLVHLDGPLRGAGQSFLRRRQRLVQRDDHRVLA